MTLRLSPADARALAADTLARCSTDQPVARSVATALVEAELIGQVGHGLRRLPSYAAQAASGKIDGRARPSAETRSAAALAIGAGHGFAYPALDLAIEQLPPMAKSLGIAAAGIRNSHHAGALGLAVERVAAQGLVGLLFANTPAAMAPWGAKEPILGTNPIAFAAPAAGRDAVVIDLSLSRAARGKVLAARQRGEPIPEDWALDADGKPTTDPGLALAGSMLPLGDAKGAVLALAVETLAVALTGANFAWEASSFFEADGNPPGVGQLMLAIAPDYLGGNRATERIAELAARVESLEGARMPGGRRQEMRRLIRKRGIDVDRGLLEAIGKAGAEATGPLP